MRTIDAIRIICWFINILADIVEGAEEGIDTILAVDEWYRIEREILEAYFPGMIQMNKVGLQMQDRQSYNAIVNQMKRELQAFYKLKDDLLDEYGVVTYILINPKTDKGYAVYSIGSISDEKWHPRRPVTAEDMIHAVLYKQIKIEICTETTARRHKGQITMADVREAYAAIKNAGLPGGKPNIDIDIDFIIIDQIFDKNDWNIFASSEDVFEEDDNYWIDFDTYDSVD